MEIIEITDKKGLYNFIISAKEFYKTDFHWVPPLISDREFLLTEKNPFWKHAEKKTYLLKDKNKVVGRIMGIIDQNYIQFHEEKAGFFGFYESVNDVTVTQKLLDTIKEWLVNKGMKKMLGPMNPSTNDEVGFLLEGFDSSPRIMMTYNPPYYLELMEKYGLKKAKDLYAYIMQVKEGPGEKLEKLSRKLSSKLTNLTIRHINLNDFDAEVNRAVEIYNNAWEKNWGFVPWTREEFAATCKQLKPLFIPETSAMALIDNKPVGILIAVPDYNQVLKHLNGKLGPIEIAKFLYYKNKITGLRLLIMGVVKEFRNRGIEGLMYLHSWKGALKKGFVDCEFSWILEDNVLTQRAAEFMGGKVYKKYRLYETSL